MSADHRISLLSMVRPQIEINLCQVADAAASANDQALGTGVTQLHQVSGALRMVQLPGAARYCAEIETALRTALRAAPPDKNEIETVGRAATRLREFTNDVAGGGAYQPLQLMAEYRELAKISSNDAASEKDLFFPDSIEKAPVHVNPRAITPVVLPALVKDLRSRYQRGLLAWLKESGKPDGLKQMRDVLDALHQIAQQLPEPRALWWASVALLECVMELLSQPAAADWVARIKPVCSRVDFLLRDLAAKGTADTTPAQRDVFYAIASCRFATPRLREVQQLLSLDTLFKDTQSPDVESHQHKPILDDLRARLENIKGVWTEYAAGEPKRLERFRDMVGPLAQRARELGNLPLLHLLLAIQAATAELPDPYPLDGQVMSLEMASALLMTESIVSNFDNLPSDVEQQVGLMKGWLTEAASGKIATSTPTGLRADIVQKANDEKLRIATAREILKSLQQVEKAVESFANDPAKRPALQPLSDNLRQVRGVFEISNQKRAARLASACQYLLERCLNSSDSEPQQAIEWLAEGLGSLGFYLDPCLHGKAPAERAINLFFARHENQPGFDGRLDKSQSIPTTTASTPTATLAATAITPGPMMAAPPPAPEPLPVGADREMLEIFLEEASEVSTAMESSIAQARTGDHDAMINVRRAFHTFKGSARMVGLSAFGECAWELEQLMNQWLATGQKASAELLDLVADARVLFAQWAHALQGDEAPPADAEQISQRARALRGDAPKQESAPTAAATATAEPQAAEPEVAATVAPPDDAAAETPIEDFMTLMPAAVMNDQPALPEHPAAAPSHSVTLTPDGDQTLADLGDRLSWLSGLVDQIRAETSANGTMNSRLVELAQMMSESMGEALALHKALQEKRGTPDTKA